MKYSLGPRLKEFLASSKNQTDLNLKQIEPAYLHEVRQRIDQVKAATSVQDMEFPFKLRTRSVSGKVYQLRLKFAWEWPLPLYLQINAGDEEIWELELVRPDTPER